MKNTGEKRYNPNYSVDDDSTKYVNFNYIKSSDATYVYKIKKGSKYKILYNYTKSEYLLETVGDNTKVNMEHGWYLSKPGMARYLKIREEDDTDLYGIFQTIDGEVLSWKGTFYEESHSAPDGSFKFTKSDEYRFVVDGENLEDFIQHPKGFKYNFSIVSDSKGIKYYFESSSTERPINNRFYLRGIEDRYGNIIQYTDNYANKLIDTYGNEIQIRNPYSGAISIHADDAEVVMENGENEKILVRYSHKTVNDDERDPYNIFRMDDFHLFTVKKAESGYDIEDTPNKTEYLMKRLVLNGLIYNSYDAYHQYDYYSQLMPIEVRFSDGMKRVYSYEINSKNSRLVRTSGGPEVKGKVPYITAVYDIAPDGTKKNEYTYKYNFMESYALSMNYLGFGLWSTSTIVTRVEDSQNKKYTFTGDSNTKKPQNRMISTIQTNGATRRNETMEYSNLRLSVHTVSETSGSIVNKIDFDRYKNITKEEFGDKIVNYTYDTPTSSSDTSPHYSIMTSKTYSKDADTTVSVRNTLTADKKSVATSSVYENDVLKSTTNYTYNSDGTVATESITLSEGSTILNSYTYEYYSNGSRKVTKTVKNRVDADGMSISDLTTSTVYDFLGNVIETVDGNGEHTYYEYDIQGRLLKTTNPDGTCVVNEYDVLANTAISTDANGNKIKYKYNSWGDFTDAYLWTGSSWDILEHQDYDSIFRPTVLYQYRDSNKYYKYTTSYDRSDRVTSQSITDNSGVYIRRINNTYSYEGDSNGRPNLRIVTKITKSGEATSVSANTLYDYRGLALEKKLISANKTLSYKYDYDYMGNMTSSTDPKGTTSTYAYDYAGNQISAKDAQGNVIRNGYDEAGRKIWTEDAEGNRTSYYYDTAGMNIKTVSPFGNNNTSTVKMYYDSNGNVTSQAVQSNAPGEAIAFNKTSYTYDNMNRLATAVSYPSEDTSVYTQYFYDNSGNTTHTVTGLTSPISAVSDAPATAAVNTYAYDSMNRVISHTNPLGYAETYTYDKVGNTLTKTDANGTKLSYTYDADNNVTSITTLNAADGVSSSNVSIAYNFYGLPTSKTVNGVTTNYTYDDFQRLTTESSGNITKNYTYDDNGNILSIGVLKGSNSVYSMNYTYDSLNRMTKAAALDMTGTFTYTPNGNVSKYTLGGVSTTYTYDDAGLLTSLTKGTELSETYTYARNGNKVLTVGTGTGVSRNEYTYDGMGRLVSETADTFSATYTYDTFGNRATKQQIKDGVTSNTAYTYDLADRLTYLYEASGENASEITYTYDNAGNLINRLKGFYEPLSNNEEESISVTTGTSPYVDMFAYNALGQLTCADIGGNVSSYTYDADGLRNSITSNGATTNLVNISGSVVAEITPNGTSSYYRAGNQIMYANNGTANNVYTYNGHGDVIKVGTDVYTYDAFGNTLAQSTNGQPFRYCGEYQDLCSGLIYLRNRYYDPSIGRFITEDPIRSGTNWYIYANNNPVNYIDPLGLAPSVMEAALMADHVYNHNWDEPINNRRIYDADGNYTGWRMIDMFTQGTSKIGVYVRGDGKDSLSTYTGPMEYVLSYKGTKPTSVEDWKNNAQQFIGEYSEHLVEGMVYTSWFVDSKKDYEITFTGHSKGGGEAAVNAEFWNKNAIVFNPSVPDITWALADDGYVKPYVVTNEILNYVLGEIPLGTTKYLKQQHNGWLPGTTTLDRINNHGMEAVIAGLIQGGY